MGLLVHLPNLAGARRPSPCGGHRRARGGARFSVSAAAPGGGVKEEEEEEEEEEEKGTRGKERIVIRVSDPVRERRLPPPLFSSPDAPSPAAGRRRRKGEDEDDGEDRRRRYHVNVGDAIRALREELPAAFYREPSFHIYRDDIVFKDPINNFTGIDNYKRIFWALRFTGQIFFKALWIDIISIWQPVEDVIMIRWIVHGIPRVLSDGPGRFEGTSEYKFDKNGKIYEHKVDNVAKNTPTKFKVLPVVELIRSLGCPSTPKPTYFETSSLQLISLLPFWFKLTWMRCYLSLYLILANLSKG
ncbi:uncharacterized protein [Oryza sativa Japonica Group]|uniref:Os05g0215600 protein n=5 Tax=Oryza TaxID=4527 RepID=Q0DJX6_ORYSJ|nr:uncharacterized protein LOC4338114 [Oryza sativa Japonica Group]XP_052155956.1 uncharacterized protein LOC127773814 [Oryza glaberrima]KAF2929692.1 hypothetical protein DAI22_05g075200 [Oryza sativa Japonica Group]BAF16847.1 Os05g0215600 [Oryza sativa Japonica Group]BAG90064.1 unnamed protein product [Oryza sativa Japonica Group]BAS92832.1 Os05g0215600 [Oryza sativa Japonica Group]|eukprot:NP_001054933.1 Os05g0215600 [Oryza sativa Japonica Group]